MALRLFQPLYNTAPLCTSKSLIQSHSQTDSSNTLQDDYPRHIYIAGTSNPTRPTIYGSYSGGDTRLNQEIPRLHLWRRNYQNTIKETKILLSCTKCQSIMNDSYLRFDEDTCSQFRMAGVQVQLGQHKQTGHPDERQDNTRRLETFCPDTAQRLTARHDNRNTIGTIPRSRNIYSIPKINSSSTEKIRLVHLISTKET